VVTGAIWIGGALAGGDVLVPIWMAALVADYAGPIARYWVPGLGRAHTSEWKIDAHHFAERFQLLIIIALGETIIVTGATAYKNELDAATVAAVVLAFAVTAALWWLYFNFVAERSTARLASAEDPGKLARDAFTYLHLPIVMGIILVAVASGQLVKYPMKPFEVPMLAVAGPVLYLIGHNLFRLSMAGSISIGRLVATFLLLMLIPLASTLSALAVTALVFVVLLGLIVREEFIDVSPLESDASPHHGAV
jgi:low temperature requirement protein LtrA